MAKGGLTMAYLNAWLRWNPIWRELWMSARDIGEEWRRLERLGVAEKHAVEGWNEPVYFQGQKCGLIRKYDHRLLQWLIEADEPAKYRAHHEGSTVNVQVNQLMQALAGTGPASIIKPQVSREITPPPPNPLHTNMHE
jgi:hypothetical protein